MIHSISCKTLVNQISWLSLSRALRGGDQGRVTFGGGGEKVSAQAWDLALPGVLGSQRAAWKLVRLRRGWGSPPTAPILTSAQDFVKALFTDSRQRRNPSSPQAPPHLPCELLVMQTQVPGLLSLMP